MTSESVAPKSRIPFRVYWEIRSKYLAKRKPSFVLLAALIVSGIGLQLANPQIIRRVIDGALGGQAGSALLVLAGLFILVALVQQGFGVAAASVGENLAWGATSELRIDGDVAEFSNFFSQLVIRILANVLLILGVLFLESAAPGGVSTLFEAVTLVTMNFVKNLVVGPEKLLRGANTELSGFIEERLAGHREHPGRAQRSRCSRTRSCRPWALGRPFRHGILHNVPRVCDQTRGQQGRGAVWRSGAPQRRAARGAFPGADAPTRCYALDPPTTRSDSDTK